VDDPDEWRRAPEALQVARQPPFNALLFSADATVA
jgi:hypothetical protein